MSDAQRRMRDCICGKRVRLRAMRITRGVANWIEHMDSTAPCVSGHWSCAMFKPYPKPTEGQRLVQRWNRVSGGGKVEVKDE